MLNEIGRWPRRRLHHPEAPCEDPAPVNTTKESPTPASDRHWAHSPAARHRHLRVTTDDGVDLAVSDLGPRRPQHTVVFLHGLCLNSTSWAPEIDRIVRRYGPAVRVISYDHRGHGSSAKAPLSTYNIDQLAEDFAAVLSALEVTGPLTVVGHSMGGMTALAYLSRPATQQPADPTGLVLVATAAGKLAQRGLGRLLTTPGTVALAQLVTHTPEHMLRGLINPLCATLVRVRNHVPTATFAAVALAALTTTPAATAIGFLPTLRTYDLYPNLHAIRARTVIVSGGMDALTPQAHARDLAAAIPGALHLTVPDAGHMLPQQAPEVIDQAIRDVMALELRSGVRHHPWSSRPLEHLHVAS